MSKNTSETVLITGASSGIGRELAKLFAKDGSNLVLVARREDRLKELADELESKYGTKTYVLPKDLARKTAQREISSFIKKNKIDLDVLVNNAGFGSRAPFAEIPAGSISDMVEVNVGALTNLTRLFLPKMIEKNSGGILNVGSLAGFQPGPNMAVYYATKAYVISFTEALSEELIHTNIKVSCLAPGPVNTEFGEKSDLEDSVLFKLSLMNVEPVAKAGYEGLRKGKTIVIPGARNNITPFLVRFMPRFIVRKVVKAIQS